MSKSTKNYSFVKPELTDAADITATNKNWDKVDNELLAISNKIDDEVLRLSNKMETQYDDRTKIFKSSYNGRGKQSVTLAFDFSPKMVFVQRDNAEWGEPNMLFLVNGVTKSALLPLYGSHSGNHPTLDITWQNKSVTFTTTINDYMNESGHTYHYVAIG